jgi:hypothetical protein
MGTQQGGSAWRTLSPGEASAGSGLAPHPPGPFLHNIANPNSKRCIGISTGLAGIWDCTENPDQLWWFAYDDWCTTDGLCWTHIRNQKDECLGIWGGSTAAGARAVGYTCLSNKDQYWRVLDDGEGNSYLANMNGFYSTSPSYVLGVNGGLTDNGTQIVLFWPDGTFNQRWNWQRYLPPRG